MNIGYSILTVRPGMVGGAETYLQELLRVIPTSTGVDRVVLFANRGAAAAYEQLANDSRIELKALSSVRTPSGTFQRALNLGRSLAAPKRIWGNEDAGLDLIHFPVAVGLPEPTVPWAVTLHDVAHHSVPELFSRADRAYRAIAYDRAAKHAGLVITVSEHAKGQIVTYLGVAPEKVVAIPLGIDHQRFFPGPVDSDMNDLNELNLPGRYVLYPANMWDHKNHLKLIAAFGDVTDKDLHLVLTGQTYGRDEELRSSIERAGLARRVHHLGHVRSAVLPALYRGSLGLVFPSLFEGFGIPPLEAMACGVPVACSHTGSLGEVVADAALVFAPTDRDSISTAIDDLVSNEGLRRDLTRAGMQRANEFTWARARSQHLAAYESLLA